MLLRQCFDIQSKSSFFIFKKVQKVTRYKKVQKGTKKYKKVQKGTKRNKKEQKGTQRYKTEQKGT